MKQEERYVTLTKKEYVSLTKEILRLERRVVSLQEQLPLWRKFLNYWKN
jgi:polyhydroxyalkanoate synthesis regulator phasin